MKSKLLLLMCCAVALGGSINAQTASRNNGTDLKETVRRNAPLAEQISAQQTKVTPVAKNATIARKGLSEKVNANCTPDQVPTGGAPNALTVANNSRSNINYNKQLHTVAFIHRAIIGYPAAVTTTGYYVMDYSTDDGVTWTYDQLIRSDPTGAGDIYRGRYPLCDIYNPASNTDLTKAYLVFAGPYTSTVAPPSWRGSTWGTASLGTPSDTNQHETALNNEAGFMENLFVTKNGTAWRVGQDYKSSTDTFANTIHLAKGTFNTGTTDFDYVVKHPAYPVDPGLGGTLDLDIVFGDDNTTGYLATITNQDPNYVCTTDTTWYISVYKTTDGGTTWGTNYDIDLRSVFDAQLANDGSTYASGTDFDLVVDKNNNLHIISTIHPSTGYTYYFGPGIWGVYDIYTTDGGATWQGELLDRPATFRGVFGPDGAQAAFNEYARPFASRSDDGSKLFFGWFDTDTALFGLTVGNTEPNLIMKAYDVTNNKWTPVKNMTSNTNATDFCTFGNGSYYVMDDDAGTYTIPVFVQRLQQNPGQIIHTTQMYYIPGLCFNSADFTENGSPVSVPELTCTPHSALVGIDEIGGSGNKLSVSGNYPNPFTGTTTIVVSLPKSGSVTVEVSNMVGQVLSTKTYKNLGAGNNSLTVDCNGFAAGLYIYKVKSGAEMVTNTMTVK